MTEPAIRGHSRLPTLLALTAVVWSPQHRQEALFPQGGFIVTNMSARPRAALALVLGREDLSLLQGLDDLREGGLDLLCVDLLGYVRRTHVLENLGKPGLYQV